MENVALRQGLYEVRQDFKALLVEALVEGQHTGQFCDDLDADATADRLMEAIQGMVISLSLDQQVGNPVEEVWVRLDAFLH